MLEQELHFIMSFENFIEIAKKTVYMEQEPRK